MMRARRPYRDPDVVTKPTRVTTCRRGRTAVAGVTCVMPIGFRSLRPHSCCRRICRDALMTSPTSASDEPSSCRTPLLPVSNGGMTVQSAGDLTQGALEGLQPTRTLTAGGFDAVVVAVFATVVSAAGAARPSLWFDEAATISAGTRSIPELWRLLGNIDAVHGLYYLFMHGWFTVFPATEFWSRLPSCLAVGVAAAGVVVLGRQFSSRTVAVAAGIVFSILPRVTWAGSRPVRTRWRRRARCG